MKSFQDAPDKAIKLTKQKNVVLDKRKSKKQKNNEEANTKTLLVNN